MDYLLHILIVVHVYIIVAVSLNLLVGYTGLVSVAHAGLYGVGAYAGALLSTWYGGGFAVGFLGAIAVAAAVGALVGMLAVRLRDDLLVIATLCAQMLLYSVFNNWIEVTNGPLGVAGIPRPTLFGWKPSSNLEFFLLTVPCVAIACWVVLRLVQSPFGRVLRSIREDELYAQALGKNTPYYKVAAFLSSAGLVGAAGYLYAHYVRFIDPTSFTFMESILMLSIVIIGGAGRLFGSVVGAVILVSAPELLRFLDVPSGIAANIRQVLYGALLVLVVLFRPLGICGTYTLSRRRAT